MIAIRAEIEAVASGRMDRADNPLKHAPHTAAEIAAEQWRHAYSREVAAFPAGAGQGVSLMVADVGPHRAP